MLILKEKCVWNQMLNTPLGTFFDKSSDSNPQLKKPSYPKKKSISVNRIFSVNKRNQHSLKLVG
jgi:hypothetical protein